MATKTVSRREFLKLALAGAAAAGLSHFRVLNLGGVQPVAAAGCVPNGSISDACPVVADICIAPAQPDTCFAPTGNADHCGETGASGPTPDTCAPPDDADVCDLMIDETDQCGEPGIPDTCAMNFPKIDPDICGAPGNMDACQPFDDPPDTVNAVSMQGVQARGGAALSALGAAAAVVTLGSVLTKKD